MMDDLASRLSSVAQAPQQNQGQDDLADRLKKVSDSVNVVDPQGKVSTISASNIDSARQAGMMPTPDSGVRMITPQGQITYALPQEVTKFRQSGHVLVNKDRTYNVTPLPGEDNVDTMARAGRIARGYADQASAVAAEKKTITPKRVAGTLAAAPVMGFTGAAAIAGAGELGGAGYSGIQALTAPSVATSTVGTGLVDAAGKEITREAVTYGPSVLRAAATSPIARKAAVWIAGKALEGAGLGLVFKVLGLFK